jgi:hypothetical protein
MRGAGPAVTNILRRFNELNACGRRFNEVNACGRRFNEVNASGERAG